VITSGNRLARNAVLNLVGQVLPAIAAVVCIPIALHGLGVQRFSVLSLTWVLLAYLTIFDVGLGRAAVRFLSAALAESRYEQVAMIVWTTVSVELAMGLVGGGVLAAAAPFLANHFLKVDPSLLSETTATLYVLAGIVPFLLVFNGLKGVLEANQRFDLVNLVRTVSTSATFIAPALGVLLHWDLPRILLVIGLSLLAAVIAYLALALRVCPGLNRRPIVEPYLLGRIFRFGGWVTVSSLLVPLIAYSDRLLITGLTSVAGLAYYAIPYEVTTRIQVIPNSVASVLYPAFSAMPVGRVAAPQIGRLYAGSLKYLLLLMSPIMLTIALTAHTILSVWIDPAFADRSTTIMQLLALGVLLNSLAFVPIQLLDARDRPDLRAKVFCVELAWYVPVSGVLIAQFGLMGAAVSVVFRGAFDVVAFFLVAWPLSGLVWRGPQFDGLIRAAAICIALSVPSALLVKLGSRLNLIDMSMAALLVAVVVGVLWRFALDGDDRARLVTLVRRRAEAV
jgi:O-antigen/teichoic acid export membrane protein